LQESLTALEKDHDYLLAGGVFSKEIINSWISYKKPPSTITFAHGLRLRNSVCTTIFSFTDFKQKNGFYPFFVFLNRDYSYIIKKSGIPTLCIR